MQRPPMALAQRRRMISVEVNVQNLLGEGGERVAAVAVAAVGVELVESGALGDQAVGDGGEAGFEKRG